MRVPMKCLIAALAATVSVTLVASPQAPPPAANLAQAIQAHYAAVRDFTADFTHAYKGGLLPQTTVEYGKVRIKKPGRMRWTYTRPEFKEIVADGRLLYTYIKADRVCYVSDLPTGDQAPTALQFLTGKGDLVRDFTAALAPNQSASEWRLQLTPITRQADYVRLTIGVDPKSLRMITLESIDADEGKSAFTFANLRENVSVPDKEFLFAPPKGVDVIR
ncbi:MAG: outer membrane lipoprotein carrier protein LolA [Acidobacteria bacterium]|nr:MAG: outer membrane lipoprotein carrier protein LolA [Acidobacteriota bacterium]